MLPLATPLGVMAIATSLLLAAVPMRASADPCPPPKDGIFGGPFCPQAFLNSSNSQTRTKHAAIRHKAAESIAEGAGNSTCAEFNKESAQISSAEDTYFVWAEGYMTGMNFTEINDSGQSRNLFSKSESEQEHAIHRLCAGHPDQPYFNAVIVFFHSLPMNTPIKALHSSFLK
jgi:hypothetical protein